MDLFVVFLALAVSAVFQINLLDTFAVFEVTYKIICLSFLIYRKTVSRQRKTPIRSGKRDGRLRHRRR
ncbi:hypothetical protein B5E62_01695 [Lachnoclostridium sp. An118]|nr:hypothetical protein B5E62_01695 [Lachnoclostridium sp. An118]